MTNDMLPGMPAMSGKERFLPDFRSLGATLVLSLLGQLFAVMFTLAAVSTPEKFWAALGLNSLFILWVVLICQAILALAAKRLDRMRAVGAGSCVFTVVVSVSLLMTWLAGEFSKAAGEPLSSLPFLCMGNGVLAGLASAVGLRYQYVQYLLRLQAKAESSARLEALQSRMRPHFLFNSLNAIASLTRRDPALAEELTLDLAELFRAILRADAKLSTLEEECALSRQYLNIERQRLGQRLRVVWAVDDGLLSALVPPLSLQPLIENAVYHGIEPSAEGGELEISCQTYKKNQIILSVRNSLPDNGERMERPGNRIALKNLRLRLQSFFGDEGKLTASMAEGFYQVRIIIPYTARRRHEDSAG